jgi:hypothetical protein
MLDIISWHEGAALLAWSNAWTRKRLEHILERAPLRTGIAGDGPAPPFADGGCTEPMA